jgi:hypothetical protein
MADDLDDEHIVLAWLCTHLPELRADADRDGWTHRLDAAITALRNSAPATQVCRRLGLSIDIAALRDPRGNPTRGTVPATIGDFVAPRVLVHGDYLCPHGSCERRGRPDRHGREPVCADGSPMLLSSGPAPRP